MLSEGQAARLAAARGDVEVFEGLHREFEDAVTLLAIPDPARHDYYALVARFDLAFDGATRNPYLVSALHTLRTHLVRVRRLARDDDERLRAAAAEHGLIVRAIADRDQELTAHATHVHLHNALQSVLANTRHRTTVIEERTA